MKTIAGFIILLLMISSCKEEKDKTVFCDNDFAGIYQGKLQTIIEVPLGTTEQLRDVDMEISQTIDQCSIIFMIDSSLQVEAQVNDSGIFTSFEPDWVNTGDYSTNGKFFGTDSVQIFFSFYHEDSPHEYYYKMKYWLGKRK
jgi:hypothetical protein